MYWGTSRLPSSHISLTRRTFKLLGSFILIACCSWALNCCDTGTKPSLFAGTWTGYLSFGSNDSGYNTTTVSDDRTCCLIGEISGERSGWGAYRLLIEGEPVLDASGYVSGDIAITRFRTGIDTTQTAGTWWGNFSLSSKVASGSWSVIQDAAFSCSGSWMAVKK